MLLVTTIISMLALGWVVWITVQRQEAGDDAFQAKLDHDDERARREREAMHQPRESDEDAGERSGS
jgi:hypothetical protein